MPLAFACGAIDPGRAVLDLGASALLQIRLWKYACVPVLCHCAGENSCGWLLYSVVKCGVHSLSLFTFAVAGVHTGGARSIATSARACRQKGRPVCQARNEVKNA